MLNQKLKAISYFRFLTLNYYKSNIYAKIVKLQKYIFMAGCCV